METAHLKAFLKISEYGSITRAAESLGIAQPSLSQQLLRLEDELGFSLFDRSARGVVLTEAGHIFRERARHILQAADEAIADGRHLRGDLRGQVVLAMPPSMGRLIAVPLIAALGEQSTAASVRIVDAYSGAIRGWLETGKIDLGILYESQSMRHLSTRRLCRETLFAVGKPDILARHGIDHGADPHESSMTYEALSRLPLVLPGMQHGLRQLLDRESSHHGIDLPVRQEVDSLEITLALLESGAMCSVLPWSAIGDKVASGALSAARVGAHALARTMVIARNPSIVLTHASVRIEILLRQLLASMASDGSWSGQAIEE